MKVLFVHPRFERHVDAHPELREWLPRTEDPGGPSLGIACLVAVTPPGWEVEVRDDHLEPADRPTDADLVALSFFTPAATRALELADTFRRRGLQVVAGGLFPTMVPDLVAPHVDAIVVGDGETVWPQVLSDAGHRRLRPRYQAQAAVDELPVPDLSRTFAKGSVGCALDDYPLQISRICAIGCGACPPRTFSLAHCVALLDQLVTVGKHACLTEDTSWFPSGRGHRRLMELIDHVLATGQPEPIRSISTSMTLVEAAPLEHLERARAAGVRTIFLVGGSDTITRKAFTGKDPGALQQACDAMARCQDAGIEPHASFQLGGDQDDLGTADRILDFAARTHLRRAEFGIATPYPGTAQWRRIEAQRRILTREWRLYNDANVVFRPIHMTPDELTGEYLRLWREFYGPRASLSPRLRSARASCGVN